MFVIKPLRTYQIRKMLVFFFLCLDYSASATVYTTANTKVPSMTGRTGESIKGEKYISSLWKSAKDRITSAADTRSATFKLTPQGSPTGPMILQIVPKDVKQQLSLLSSAAEIDPLDLSTIAGKIIQLPDTGKGPIQILKSPGPSTSVLVRRGNTPSTVSQIKSALGKKERSETNYIGSVTSILAETLCPLCGRLRNPRYRVSCILRYCYENPSVLSGNPS